MQFCPKRNSWKINIDNPNKDVIPVTRETYGSGLKKHIKNPVIKVKGTKAGIKRFIRLSKKLTINSLKFVLFLQSKDEVITYPEITKKYQHPNIHWAKYLY